jgi:hypothetical protein
MAGAASYICECGTRLTIVTEMRERSDHTLVPCPTPGCRLQHIVSGQVLEVTIVDGDGNSVPYDWTRAERLAD